MFQLQGMYSRAKLETKDLGPLLVWLSARTRTFTGTHICTYVLHVCMYVYHMHVITYKFYCTCSLLYSKEKGFIVRGDREEKLISLEDVELSEYEKRREERIAAK